MMALKNWASNAFNCPPLWKNR